MAFRKACATSPLHDVVCNSVEAEKFLNAYNSKLNSKLVEQSKGYVPSKTFAPSSLRCMRQQWFRLRGTVPDKVSEPDATLSFIADIGTHCHENIQANLSEFLGDNWLDVEQYFKSNPPKYEYELQKLGYETRVSVKNPPVKFSCDGLVQVNGKVYLLEIKTSESSSMRSLIGPKPEHMDQIACYCTLMGLEDAIVLYQSRQYGDMKCFTYHLSSMDRSRIESTFSEVQKMVSKNMIPDALPVGDKWCNSSYCKYFKSCRKWGV